MVHEPETRRRRSLFSDRITCATPALVAFLFMDSWTHTRRRTRSKTTPGSLRLKVLSKRSSLSARGGIPKPWHKFSDWLTETDTLAIIVTLNFTFTLSLSVAVAFCCRKRQRDSHDHAS